MFVIAGLVGAGSTNEVAQAQPVIRVTGYSPAVAVGANGSLSNGYVDHPYTSPRLQITGGTAPYKLCGATTTGACLGPPGGTLADTGVTAKIIASQVVFGGTPKQAGGFAWSGVVHDSAGGTSAALVLTVQVFDYTRTSTYPLPFLETYYNYGPGHCCLLWAEVSSYHAGSGSPAGTVTFFVDGHDEGKAPLNFSYYDVPKATTAEIRSDEIIDAGTYTLKAQFNGDPPPAGICWPNYQDINKPGYGPPRNCFLPSDGRDVFKVRRAPTITQLFFPTTTATGSLSFAVTVSNKVSVTKGDAEVDPGGPVQLFMGDRLVKAVAVPARGEPVPDLVVSPPPGRRTFVARYAGDRNETPSMSSPMTLLVTRR